MSLINEMLAGLDARRPERRARQAEELRGLAAPEGTALASRVPASRIVQGASAAAALLLAAAGVLAVYQYRVAAADAGASAPVRGAASTEVAQTAVPAVAPVANAPLTADRPSAAQAGASDPGGARATDPPLAGSAQTQPPEPGGAAAAPVFAPTPPAPSEPLAAAAPAAADPVPVMNAEAEPVPEPQPHYSGAPAIPGAAADAVPAALAPAEDAAPARDASPSEYDPALAAELEARPDDEAPAEELALPGAAPRMERSERPESRRASAERAYRRGLEEQQNRRSSAAMRAFRQALEIDPDHVPAREALVGALLQSGKLDDANLALGEASGRAPQDPRIAKLTARVALQRGEPRRALEALQRLPESGDPEHHALLAATYQRLGDAPRAAAAYRALAALEPDQPAHWLGLGIALERSGRRADALRAYRAASDRPGLNEAAARYAEDRIASLERTGPGREGD